MAKVKVGIIGLGSMGMGIGLCLIRNKIPTYGFDIDSFLCEKLLSSGAVKCGHDFYSSVSDLDILLIVVLNSEQIEKILFEKYKFSVPENLASQLKSSCIIINHSTISSEDSKSIGEKLQCKYNLGFLDAPMSGGSVKAVEGKLTLIVSGTTSYFEKCEPIFKLYSEKIFFVGENVGAASTVKIIHQLLAGVHIAATAESLAMAAKAGIPLKLLYDIVSSSAGNSWMFENRGLHIVKGDYTPHSAVDIFVKDLQLVLQTGNSLDMTLPLASQALKMFQDASEQGYGKLDDSAVIKIFPNVNLPENQNESE